MSFRPGQSHNSFIRGLIKARMQRDIRDKLRKERTEARLSNTRYPPVIPFKKFAFRTEPSKFHSATLKLRTNPEDDKSEGYEVTVPYFSSGSPEQWLEFQEQLREVFTGQNVKTANAMVAMTRRLLRGDALTAFNTATHNYGADTTDKVILCLQAVTTHIFPASALDKQRKYLTHELHKPDTMKMKDFAARLVECNNFLKDFPPKFDTSQRLRDVELIAVAEDAVSELWHLHLTEDKFDPSEHTLDELVAEFESIENTEWYTKTLAKYSAVPDYRVSRKRRQARDRRDAAYSTYIGMRTPIKRRNDYRPYGRPFRSQNQIQRRPWSPWRNYDRTNRQSSQLNQERPDNTNSQQFNRNGPTDRRPSNFPRNYSRWNFRHLRRKNTYHKEGPNQNEINAMVQDGIKQYMDKQKKSSAQANNESHSLNQEESHATEAVDDEDSELNTSTAHMTIEDHNMDVDDELFLGNE